MNKLKSRGEYQKFSSGISILLLFYFIHTFVGIITIETEIRFEKKEEKKKNLVIDAYRNYSLATRYNCAPLGNRLTETLKNRARSVRSQFYNEPNSVIPI